MREKGVSPLIATIILIAFVVAIAAIASQFLTTFQQTRQSEITAAGEQVIECGNAVIEIIPDSVTWGTVATNDLVLAVENKGTTDLAINTIVYSNKTHQIRDVVMATRKSDNSPINASSPLKAASILTIHNNTVSYRPDRITVTTNCPGVTASVENDTATNKFKKVFG